MTLTLADVFALTCLPPMGASAHGLMASDIDPEDDILKGITLSYNDFIKEVKGASNSKEECCFYLFWICKFFTCTSSKLVINYYLPIA